MRRFLTYGGMVIVLVLMIYGVSLYPFSFTMARTAVGEIRTAQMEAGNRMSWYVSGEGPRIVLAASLAREASDFNELVMGLNSAGFRTLTVEAPGIGESDLLDSPISLYRLADDVARIVALDVQETGQDRTVAMIGHAFGNRVMRATASAHPKVAERVILLAAGGQRPIAEKAQDALLRSLLPFVPGALREEAIRYAFFAGYNDIPDYWLRGWHFRTALMQITTATHTEGKEWHTAGGVPMLIIQANSDTIAPKEDAAFLLKEQLGDQLTVTVIPNTGHALLPEAPKQIIEAVLGFVRG